MGKSHYEERTVLLTPEQNDIGNAAGLTQKANLAALEIGVKWVLRMQFHLMGSGHIHVFIKTGDGTHLFLNSE